MSPQIFAGINRKEKTWFIICNVASLPLKLTFHTACVQLKSKNFVAIISHQFLKHIEPYNTHPFIENDTNILGANSFRNGVVHVSIKSTKCIIVIQCYVDLSRPNLIWNVSTTHIWIGIDSPVTHNKYQKTNTILVLIKT